MKMPATLFACAAALLAAPASAAPIRKPIPVTAFDRIRIDGDYKVLVTGDAGYSLVAEGAADDLAAVQAEVQGGALRVFSTARTLDERRAHGIVTLRLSLGAARRIELNGSASLDFAGASEPRLELSLNGPSSATLTGGRFDSLLVAMSGPSTATIGGKTGELVVKILGPGTLDASGLSAGSGKVSVAGAATARIDNRGPFTVTAYGQSVVDLLGSGKCVREGGSQVAVVTGCKP